MAWFSMIDPLRFCNEVGVIIFVRCLKTNRLKLNLLFTYLNN